MGLKTKRGITPILALAALLILVFGCSPSLDKFDSLANQGILPLSNDNAHLGANLFLAREAQRSSYLRSFLEKRGGPTAIEVLTESRSHPTMILFYPLKKEVYAADLDSTENSYQWILRGPFMMERQDYRELNGMGVSFAAEPVFLMSGQVVRFGAKPVETSSRALLPVVPTPRPTPVRKKSSGAIINRPAVEIATPFKPLNSDQQAIAISQGFAERADNGDLIHTVRSEKETVEELAAWYTGAPANASMIRLRNNLLSTTPLTPGMRIQIPFASVKQFKVFQPKQ